MHCVNLFNLLNSVKQKFQYSDKLANCGYLTIK